MSSTEHPFLLSSLHTGLPIRKSCIRRTLILQSPLTMHGFKIPRPGRNYWREVPHSHSEAVKCFTPQMFTICMGTGILAVLLHNNPYQFDGLGMSTYLTKPPLALNAEIISTIVWILDLVFFTLISLTFIIRWIRFPTSTANLFEHDIEQTTYLSTTTIALATIVELAALICGSRWNNWQYAVFAFWWFTVLISLVSSTAVYWLLIRDEKVAIDNLTPTLMYPTTGLLATATAGSVVVNYTPLSIKLSMPVIIVSYLLLGAGTSCPYHSLLLRQNKTLNVGFFLCLLTMSAYFLRLLHNQTPSPHKVGAQLIPLAPLSNAAYSFITLGYLIGPKKHVFEEYAKGPVATSEISLSSPHIVSAH